MSHHISKEGRGAETLPSQPSQKAEGSRVWLAGADFTACPGRETCAVGMGAGPAGGAGSCLQGLLRALRRLLHLQRLHKGLPAWGCPGAGRPL